MKQQTMYARLNACIAACETLRNELNAIMAEMTGNEEPQTEQIELPEEAWLLLERARDGGLLDETWQPLVSNTEAALLANTVSSAVWGERRWRCFEKLWGKNQLQRDYQTALCLRKMDVIQREILDILGIPPGNRHD